MFVKPDQHHDTRRALAGHELHPFHDCWTEPKDAEVIEEQAEKRDTVWPKEAAARWRWLAVTARSSMHSREDGVTATRWWNAAMVEQPVFCASIPLSAR